VGFGLTGARVTRGMEREEVKGNSWRCSPATGAEGDERKSWPAADDSSGRLGTSRAVVLRWPGSSGEARN
jgi:hypothetical protein